MPICESCEGARRCAARRAIEGCARFGWYAARECTCGGKTSPIEASFFYLIQKLQLVADVPTWLGAHDKAVEAGNDDTRAVALADQAVIDAQGGGATKDLAEIQRGGPLLKLFTNFYSYFSTTYQLSAESVARTKFTDPLSVGRLTVDFLMLYTLPAALGMLLKDALRGDEDDDGFAEKLAREQLAFIAGTVVGGRELGSALQGYSYRGPTGTRFFAEASRLFQQGGARRSRCVLSEGAERDWRHSVPLPGRT